MMKKKILTLALGACMIASLAACGSDESDKKEKTEAVFTIGEYKGVEVSESAATVTDKELQDYIDYILKQNQKTNTLDKGTTKEGDQITAIYTAKVDDKEVSALSSASSGSKVTLKDGSFTVKGFVEKLIGKNVGDKTEFDVTIAENETGTTLKDYAGKTVHYNVEIKNIVETVIPTLTDEWVKETYGYLDLSTAQEFKDYHKKLLYKSDVYEEIESKLLEGVKVTSYDSDMLEEMTDYYLKSFENQIGYYGITLDAYYQAMDKTESDLRKEMEEKAKDYLKQRMLIEKVAEVEGLQITDEEYNEKIVIYAKDMGFDKVEELESYYNGVMDKDDYMYAMLGDKVQEFICENVKVVPDKETETTNGETEAATEAK